MYIQVENETEKEVFKQLYLKTKETYDFSYNEVRDKEERFLLLKRPLDRSLENYKSQLIDHAIGTLEINPYNSQGYSIVQQYSKIDLSQHPSVLGREQETFEVCKMYIDEQYQSRGYFNYFLTMIADYSDKTNTSQCLASMVIPLYEVVKRHFEKAIQQVGPLDEEKVQGMPVLVDVEQIKNSRKFLRIQRRLTSITV